MQAPDTDSRTDLPSGWCSSPIRAPDTDSRTDLPSGVCSSPIQAPDGRTYVGTGQGPGLGLIQCQSIGTRSVPI